MNHEKYLTTPFRKAKNSKDWKALERRAIFGFFELCSVFGVYVCFLIYASVIK